MFAQSNSAVLSPLQILLQRDGIPLIAFGIVLSLWGLWNIFRPLRATSILSQIVLSVIPGLIAVVVLYTSCVEFTELATSETPPKPAEFASLVGRAMSYGFCGLLSTIVPVLLGTIALRQNCRLQQSTTDGTQS